MAYSIKTYESALNVLCPIGLNNAEWVKIGMAAKDAGIAFSQFDDWCASDPDGYPGTAALHSRWNSWKPENVTAGTLIYLARDTGWEPDAQKRLSDEQAEAQRQDRAKKAAQARLEQQQQHQEAAMLAQVVLSAAGAATSNHPYLTQKGVDAEGLSQMLVDDLAALIEYCPKSGGQKLEGMILIAPVQQIHGAISTVELIDEQGRKTALAGGKKAGGYWLSGTLPDGFGPDTTIAIAEGIATAKSVHQAIGGPVLAALSCHNLHRVAEAMKQRYPAARLLVCGDLGNGQQDAETAAASVGAALVLPVFPEGSKAGLSDFNDLASAAGIDAVRQQIEEAMSRKNAVTPPDFDTSSKKDDDIGMNGDAGAAESFWEGEEKHRDERDTVTNPVFMRLLGCHAEDSVSAKSVTTVTQMGEICEKYYVPKGYRLYRSGLFREFEQKGEVNTERVCNPLLVLGLTKGVDGRGHGLLLAGLTVSGARTERTMPAAVLHGDAAVLAGELEDVGLAVEPGKAKHLVACLGGMRRLAQNRPFLTGATRLGWLDGDRLAYLLPSGAIGADGFVFQPKQKSTTAEAVKTAGTLEAWRSRIAEPALTDPVATSALLCGFAGALILPARMDTCGLHFYGTTSRGKTTILQIGASVWGDAADPNTSGMGLCKKWNSTTNNLEALAEESTGLLLPLDELGSFRDNKALSRSIYNLCAGQGAGRLNANAERKQQREWQTFILSSGEVSIRESIETGGEKQKGGTAIRVLDIPLPEGGLFPAMPDAGALVNEVKAACSECFGTAGPAFVAFLVESFQTRRSLYQYVNGLQQRYAEELAAGEAPEIKRAAMRLALMRVAGELAQEAGVLPGAASQIAEACQTIWNLWRGHMPVIDDGERAIFAIRDYILSNPAKLPSTNCAAETLPATVAGYFDGEHYLFTDEGFKAATGGVGKAGAIAALRHAGLLFSNNGNRAKSRHTVQALGGKRAEFYAVRASIIEQEEAIHTPVLSRFDALSRTTKSCEIDNVTAQTRANTGSVTFVTGVTAKNGTYQNSSETEVF
jgi:putative DNA primase/helicase